MRLIHLKDYKRSVLLFLLTLGCCVKIYAQQTIDVTGTLTDAETGKTIPGVTVKAKNGSATAVTNRDGKYSIVVPKNSILLFSFIGYTSVQKSANKAVIDVQLQVNQNSLNEVVVLGYGSSSKTKLASSTSTVTAKEYKNAVVTTIDQALQGRTSGVQVTETSGEPGADAVIRIRGNNSLSGDNQPLYVVDGFLLPTYVEASTVTYGSLPSNGLAGINPNDIESITVLKDASATAIYGSRGANGVIMIKTKSGKANQQRIEFVDKTSFGKVSNPYPMANSKQFADIVNLGFQNVLNVPAPFTQSDIDALNNTTDWFKAVTRNSLREEATLNVSGGGNKTTYYVSGTYLSDKGVVLGSENNRASIRANINSDVNDWYTFRGQLSLSRQNNARAMSDGKSFPSGDGPILDALRASPIAPLNYFGYNGEGIPGFTNAYLFPNPLTELLQKTDNTLNDFDIVNFENIFKFTKELQLHVNLGSNQTLSRRQVFFPPTTSQGFAQNGFGSYNIANTYSYNVNAYLNYIKDFNGGHSVNITGGVEYNKQQLDILNTSTSGFDIPSFGVYNIGSASTQQVGSGRQDRIIQSAFLRANYSYKDRYVLNASVRVDGASPFADNKKYGTFPAVGVAWNIFQEDFMKDVKFINNAKIRASYGETGSQAIPPYGSLSQYGNAFYQTGNGQLNTVLYPVALSNPNLSWERTQQLDIGTDFNIIGNSLGISFDYYDKKTIGLLQQRQLPSQTGFSSIIDNYGTMRNRGIELSINANIAKGKDFSYDTKITFSRNKNILLNLGDFTAPQYVGIGGALLGGVSGILQPGKEVGLLYGEKVIGLVQQSDIVNGVPQYPYPGLAANQIPGQWKYEDKNHDGVIDFNDAQVLGKTNPDFTYGWNNDIHYKRFGVSLFFTGSQGNDIVNLTRLYLSSGIPDFAAVFFNQTADWYKNRWTPSNPTNNIRYPGAQKSIPFTDINNSYVENGSYFRLKTATVYFDLPDNKVFKNSRIFVTGTNVFTITKYTGADPEVDSFGQSLLQQGIDFGSYPSIRTYTVGVSANF